MTASRGAPAGRGLSRMMVVIATCGLVAVAVPNPVQAGSGAGTKVTIYRDEHGVPHVYSDTIAGLFQGAGYATGQDRLWQADLLRRTATGTLAQLVGAGAGNSNIATDEFFRLFTGGRPHRTALYDQLSSQAKLVITSFRDGINRWIGVASSSGKLPLEYGAIGKHPRPWTADDIVATAMLSIFEFGSNGNDELANLDQFLALVGLDGGAEANKVFTDAHWVDDPTAPTTIPGSASSTAQRGASAPGRAVPVAAGEATAVASAERMLAAVTSVLDRIGVSGVGHSNAIAVAGKLTADGQALLLGGPQIGYTVPQGFMEIGLHGAGFNATGVTLAGNPGVQIGVGSGFAWTVTSGGDDNEDIYAEVLDPANHPGQYFYKGRWRPLACRAETIYVNGGSPVPLTACFTVHGPVLGISGSTAISLRDVTRENLAGSVDGFFGLDQATSLSDFVASGRKIVGSLNLTYADVHGTIAYAHVGQVPIRPAGDNPFVPHPGDGSDEWQGYIPASQLPYVANPGRGWLTNWNNKPEAGWKNASSGFWDWGPVQRVQVIMRQLAAIAPHSATTATLEAINRTTGETTESPVGSESNMFVQTLLPVMLAHVDTSADSRLPAIVSLLSNWDQLRVDANNDGKYDSPAVTVYDAWYASFASSVFAPKTGALGSANAVDDNTIADMTLRLYEGAHAGLPLVGGYLGGTTLTEATTRALVNALNRLTSQYGTADTTMWLTDDVMIHYSQLGAAPVPDIIWMNRGTYNQIIHAGSGTGGLNGENVVAPGQSGDPRTPYFADQLPLYASWAYKPMRLTLGDLQGHITSTTVFHLT